ncbi:MAG TPA: ATP-binding protein [Caulobacteraceae bacterium]|jgi:signal transduction histidine kinase/ActR/RegA family two-component response regulator|nr:ATP-binding protein [Caulobacteraceae bacterium]
MSEVDAAGRRRSIRAVLVVAGAVALLIASLTIAALNEDAYRRQISQSAQVQARVLARTVTAAVAFNDRPALRQYLDAVSANPAVAQVAVFDEKGQLVEGQSNTSLPGSVAEARGFEPGRTGVRVIVPVIEQGAKLGEVYLAYRTTPMFERLSRYLGPGLLMLMALMMFSIQALDARTLVRANQRLREEMEARERTEEALRQSQKMEAIGRLTGGIAHDFNNMLAIVIGSLDLLLRRAPQDDQRLRKLIENAITGAARAAALTRRLLAFSRLQPLSPVSTDIAKVLSDAGDLLRRTLGETVVVEVVAAGGLWRAHIDTPQLESAIVNLAINARDAMPAGGRLTLEASNTFLDRSYAEREQELRPGQYVMIAVTDSGTGMPAAVLAQVFEPFFTTKPPGQGTGLGLSQVHGFMKQSGGHVRIYSEVGHGTTVKLYLPRSSEAEMQAEAISGPRPTAQARGVTVLVVEDEAGVRDFATQALAEIGFEVISAPNAAAALRELEERPEIGVLLTDVVMPGVNGRQLADAARRSRPDLRVVFMTGYTRNAIVHNGVLDQGVRLLNKPFTIAELEAEFNDLLQDLTA